MKYYTADMGFAALKFIEKQGLKGEQTMEVNVKHLPLH